MRWEAACKTLFGYDTTEVTTRDVLDRLESQSRAILKNADRTHSGQQWHAPHPALRPHQWLWDSAFHAVTLAALGELENAIKELESLFSSQHLDGFVPHLTSRDTGETTDTKTLRPLTQPPMYGHAIREVTKAVNLLPKHQQQRADMPARLKKLRKQAERGLDWFIANRSWLDTTSLVVVCHPWETGCGNSPKWDGWLGDKFDEHERQRQAAAWLEKKQDATLPLPDDLITTRFAVADTGFSAIVAFNCMELAQAGGPRYLELSGNLIAASVRQQYSVKTDSYHSIPVMPHRDPYVQNDASHKNMLQIQKEGCQEPTLDATLGCLVDTNPLNVNRVLNSMVDPQRFGSRYGPAGLWNRDFRFNPEICGRGAATTPLSYLLWLAARRKGRNDVAQTIAEATASAALKNGFAGYWDPATGNGGFSPTPQTWATLAWVMAKTTPV